MERLLSGGKCGPGEPPLSWGRQRGRRAGSLAHVSSKTLTASPSPSGTLRGHLTHSDIVLGVGILLEHVGFVWPSFPAPSEQDSQTVPCTETSVLRPRGKAEGLRVPQRLGGGGTAEAGLRHQASERAPRSVAALWGWAAEGQRCRTGVFPAPAWSARCPFSGC